jgi:hypothetical protein
LLIFFMSVVTTRNYKCNWIVLLQTELCHCPIVTLLWLEILTSILLELWLTIFIMVLNAWNLRQRENEFKSLFHQVATICVDRCSLRIRMNSNRSKRSCVSMTLWFQS